MNYRQLGNTGITVSEIGMGCWGIGGDSYGKTDDITSMETLFTAHYNGINFFDTADTYGNGHSEELIGDVFHSMNNRKDIVIATKGGCLPHTHHTKPPMPQDFSEKHLRGALEGSLRRLKTEYIDVYQLHSPPEDTMDDALDVLDVFKQEGLIRFSGISLNSPTDNGLRRLPGGIIQANFSMIDQRIADRCPDCGTYSLLDHCNDWGVGFIARTPFNFGFLSAFTTAGAKFHSGDHRSSWSQEQIDVWAESPYLFNALLHERTHAQLALSFCLSHPISTVIPGMMTPEEVIENTKSTSLPPLSESELSAIKEIYNSHTFFIKEQ